MAVARLVMAGGTSPGAGKTTLTTELASTLAHEGVVLVSEDEVWGARRLDDGPVDRESARTEFVDLLHSGHPPTVEALEVTFDRIAQSAARTSWWLQDWTWLDLASMTVQAWKQSDASGLLERLGAHRSVVLYLKVDPQEAMLRAVAERGPTWLRQHAQGLSLPDGSSVEAVAAFYARHERDRLDRLSRCGVETAVLDAGGPRADLVEAALRAVMT